MGSPHVGKQVSQKDIVLSRKKYITIQLQQQNDLHAALVFKFEGLQDFGKRPCVQGTVII